MHLRARLVQALSSPGAPWIAGGVALLLSLPSLAGGFAADDHAMMLAFARGATAWDVFDISIYGTVDQWRETGLMGWWAAEDLRIAFFRPISSVSHWIDAQRWPDAAWAMHLGNVLLYVALAVVAGGLFRRLSAVSARGSSDAALVAGIAALLFAADDVHAQTLGWISARNTLIATVLGFAALWAHDRWRREGWRAGAVVGPCLFLAALLGAEGGLACGGYLVAHALFLDRRSWRAGVLALLPYAAIVVGWRVAYIFMGYGVEGTGLYLDVGRHPVEFLLNTARNACVLILAQLTLPVSTQVATATGGWVVAAVLLAVLAWLLWPLLRRDRLARFWAVGLVAAAAPFGATIASDRILVPLGLGASGLIARLVLGVRDGTLPGRRTRWTSRSLLACNAVLAPLLFVPSLFGVLIFEVLGQKLDDAVPEEGDVVVVNVPLDLILLYPQAIREHRGGVWPEHVYVLFTGTEPIEVMRTGARVLELQPEEGWFASPINRVARSLDRPFARGDRVSLEEMEVEVLEVSDDGRPMRARFTFARDPADLTWVTWGDDGPEPWQPPAMGERATLHGRL